LHILYLEDDPGLASLLSHRIEGNGHSVRVAATVQEGQIALGEHTYELIICDQSLPDSDGLDFMSDVLKNNPTQSCIMLTGQGDEDLAVTALKLGARDYIVKDIENNYLKLLPRVIDRIERESRVEEALRISQDAQTRLEASNRYLSTSLNISNSTVGLIGQDQQFNHVLAIIEQVAPTNATTLITGETGTGKEMVAQLIHRLSPRSERPLITVNCTALPSHLVESELFGHAKGAFTGAIKNHIGRFEAAEGGTIFLDEIGEMPIDLQPKLLRVLQESAIQRVGSNEMLPVDVRIIAATNEDLPQRVQDHTFREDLYYRLNVIPIELPALRNRPIDIELLFMHFVSKYSKAHQLSAPSIDSETIAEINRYTWPGNVRELSNYVERCIITNQWSELGTKNLTKKASSELQVSRNSIASVNSWLSLHDMEREYIHKVLQYTNGVIGGKDGAATILDINPSTLRSRMQKLGISKPTQTYD